MRRLHVQIFVTVVAAILLFGLLVSAAWWLTDDDDDKRHARDSLQPLIEEALPPPGAGRAAVDAALTRIGGRAGADITVRAADGRLLGHTGPPLPDLRPRRAGDVILYGHHRMVGMLLSDGRRVVVRPPQSPGEGLETGLDFLAGLLSFVVALIVGAWPLARRLTRRLERLQLRVEQLGAGDLAARVEVEGRDEVAALARSVNRAAEQIQRLVEAQKQTLAAASHELRTPLARLRMAVELLDDPATDADRRVRLRRQIGRDIGDLDDLIEELLLTSRLALAPPPAGPVDLLGLVAEEAARVDAVIDAADGAVAARGDERLLRRLLRNLLENARRHGGDGPVEVRVGRLPDDRVQVSVCDRGPGVPEDERGRVFEPFRRLDPAAGIRGSGLGLFLVRQIADHHGGRATCRGRPGGGACFTVTVPAASLPASLSAADRQAVAPPAEPPPKHGSVR